jgi:predicted transcriptional regulator
MNNKKRNEFLELETRRQIYNFILNNPGLHFRELSRKMNMPKSTMDYHLKYLEKKDLISVLKKERYNHYYISKKIGRENKKILSILREETPRRILLSMKIPNPVSLQYLSKDLDKSPSTISFHLKKLIKLDLVERIEINNQIKFGLKDEYKVYDLFIQYNESLSDDYIILLVDWITRVNTDMKFRDIIAHICRTDKFIDGLTEMFPYPFCA